MKFKIIWNICTCWNDNAKNRIAFRFILKQNSHTDYTGLLTINYFAWELILKPLIIHGYCKYLKLTRVSSWRFINIISGVFTSCFIKLCKLRLLEQPRWNGRRANPLREWRKSWFFDTANSRFATSASQDALANFCDTVNVWRCLSLIRFIRSFNLFC